MKGKKAEREDDKIHYRCCNPLQGENRGGYKVEWVNNYCKWNNVNIAARLHLSFWPGRYLLLKVNRWALGNHRGWGRRKRPGTCKQTHWTEVIINPHQAFGTQLQSNSSCRSKNIENNHICFVFAQPAWSEKVAQGRRRAAECRRMMNSQTGIKFHDWDSWAVMAADQRSATPPSWSSSSQWLRSPSCPQVHCAKVKSFMNVIYSYTLATEIHRIYTESLQQQTALCQYQSNSSPLCDRSSPGRPLVSMATVFSSNGLLTSALGVCRFIWMLL